MTHSADNTVAIFSFHQLRLKKKKIEKKEN